MIPLVAGQVHPWGETVFDRIATSVIAPAMALCISGCATGSAGPTIPEPGEVSAVRVNGPYFVESRDGNPFSCSTWAGTKLWLDSEDFASAVSRTLEIAQARVVPDPSLASYVLSFGGSGSTVNYEIREPGSDVVVWSTSKSWPHQVSDCALCCNDHARSHFAWLTEDLASWDGAPQGEQ